MDENVASSIDGSESGGPSSENSTKREGNKRLKLQEKEDRISALPDSLIQHILSFLPSTKEAIQTGVLSKRWQNQWTRVPVLIFDCSNKIDKNFSHFIDNTLMLHDCSRIKKFHIQYGYQLKCEPQLTPKILYATRKNVEELILLCYACKYGKDPYKLPKFLFSNASLLRLELFNCYLKDDCRAYWPCLKVLKMDCLSLNTQAIENVISGCPLLESLELYRCLYWGSGSFVIASKYLKILIFAAVAIPCGTEISCPNLEELYVKEAESYMGMDMYNRIPHQTIENVLSCSPLLHSLEFTDCRFDQLVIASKSLKKLVLGEVSGTPTIEISCPMLEELDLCGLDTEKLKLMNMPSLICATLDFDTHVLGVCDENLAKKMLEQLQHVKELKLGSSIVVTALQAGGLCPPLCSKSLTLDCIDFDKQLPEIEYALRNSPVLEKLVIRSRVYKYPRTGDVWAGGKPDSKICDESFWKSNGAVFNCLVSHLKIVKIIDLSHTDHRHKLVVNFVEFVLKNAGVLEKMLIIAEHCGTDFVFKLSKKLLSFPKCSPHAIVEVLCAT